MATWVIEGSCPALWFKIMGAGMQEWYQCGVERSHWGRLISEAFESQGRSWVQGWVQLRPQKYIQKTGNHDGVAVGSQVCGLSMQVRDSHETVLTFLMEGTLFRSFCARRGQGPFVGPLQSKIRLHLTFCTTVYRMEGIWCFVVNSFMYHTFLPTWCQVLQGFPGEQMTLTFQELTTEQKGMVSWQTKIIVCAEPWGLSWKGQDLKYGARLGTVHPQLVVTFSFPLSLCLPWSHSPGHILGLLCSLDGLIFEPSLFSLFISGE